MGNPDANYVAQGKLDIARDFKRQLQLGTKQDEFICSRLRHITSIITVIVFCNEGTVEEKDGMTYMPVYDVMFLGTTL